MRQAEHQRWTQETQITLKLNLDASQSEALSIDTDLPFLSHMLHAFACHGQFALSVAARGDVHVDPHHLIEDVGISLGQCIVKALGGHFKGIQRAGHFAFPMDGTLSQVSVDLCGRTGLVWNVAFESATIGSLDPRLFREFFKGLADGLQSVIHINVPYRDNDHHTVEATFKAFSRALRQAVTPVESEILSTKGLLEVRSSGE
ncbi:MAG: imidazoleglycerol-phosphate dehydratase [Candidatus Melainabacteria bacterium]|nr:imidazoleglycerol-phosphate dehydratase [Candidatus Melainabacteria bacterium]